MRLQRNYYEILGLTRSASRAEIKKRYRELARKYHPDVAGDKTTAAKAFVQITEAYKTLVDPEKRRAYDATLIDATQPVRPPGAAYRPSAPTASRPEAAKLVKDAELAFIRRHLDHAKELCKQAINVDNRCARAHAILGDIYRAKRLHNQAINEYNYAVQFNPADRDSQKKLEKLLEHAAPVRFSWDMPDGRLSKEAIFLNIIGWSMAVFVLLLINIYPGRPMLWLSLYHVPFINNWSWNLVGIMLGDGVLVGFLLGVNGLVDHPDDHLVFERPGPGWSVIPTGLVLLIFGPVFFLAAAVFYLVFAFVQDAISKSILKIFAATAAIVLLSALMYPFGRASVLLLGGNVAFTGALIGWYIGSILRPEETILS